MERLLTRGTPQAAASLAKARLLAAMLVCTLASFALMVAFMPTFSLPAAWADTPTSNAGRIVSLTDNGDGTAALAVEFDIARDDVSSIDTLIMVPCTGAEVADAELNAFMSEVEWYPEADTAGHSGFLLDVYDESEGPLPAGTYSINVKLSIQDEVPTSADFEPSSCALLFAGPPYSAQFDSLTGWIADGGDDSSPHYVATLSGGEKITESGAYLLAKGATGTITIDEDLNVTLVGQCWDEATESFVVDNKYVDLNVVVGNESALTIQDIYINLSTGSDPAIDFEGTGSLSITGHNLIDRPDEYGSHAVIRVGPDASVSFDGDGILYGYKHAQGAYIGADGGESNGTITFDGGTWLLKGSKTGAIIGTDTVAGGTITINDGAIYLKTVSQGAAIGSSRTGSAGKVVVNGGMLQILTDFSGSAIGYGGQKVDSPGTLEVNGGSIMTIITPNAFNSWGFGERALTEGSLVSDVNITAEHDTAMLRFVTDAYVGAASITVNVDGKAFYQGAPRYAFVTNENKNPSDFNPTTLSNWYPNDAAYLIPENDPYTAQDAGPAQGKSKFAGENALYFQLSKQDHVLSVNGDAYDVHWNGESFELASYTEPEGDPHSLIATPSPANGGTITFVVMGEEVSQAKAGQRVRVTAAAAEGFLPSGDLVVTGPDGVIEPDAQGNFVMPDGDVEAKQTFTSNNITVPVSLGGPFVTVRSGLIDIPVTISGIDGAGVTSATVGGTYEGGRGSGSIFRADMYYSDLIKTSAEQDATVTAATLSEGRWSVTVEAAEGQTLSSGVIAHLYVQVGMDSFTTPATVQIRATSISLSNASGNLSNVQLGDVTPGSLTLKSNDDYQFPITVLEGEHGRIHIEASNNPGTAITSVPNNGTRLVAVSDSVDEGWVFTSVEKTGLISGSVQTFAASGGANPTFALSMYASGRRFVEPISVKPLYAIGHTLVVDNTKSTHGTVSCASTSYAAGQSVYCVCTPDEGYGIGILHWAYVEPETGEHVEKTGDSRQIGFTMPDADTTVWMEFVAKQPVTLQAVPDNAGRLATTEFGYEDGSFLPNTTVSVYYVASGTSQRYFQRIEYSSDGGSTWEAAAKSSYGDTVTIDGESRYLIPYRFTMPNAPVQVRAITTELPVVKASESNQHVDLTFACGRTIDYKAGPVVLTSDGGPVYIRASIDEGWRITRAWYTDLDGVERSISLGNLGAASFYPIVSQEGTYVVYVETTNSVEPDLVISNADEWNAFAARLSEGENFAGKLVVIANDIELDAYSAPNRTTFAGILDGQNHTISGLAGPLLANTVCAEIKNLTVEGTITQGVDSYAGGFAAQASRSSFSHLENRCDIRAGQLQLIAVGGIVGEATCCEIVDCMNRGNVAGNVTETAGIVGRINVSHDSFSTRIERCANYGVVTSNTCAAGIAAQVGGNVVIESCANKGVCDTTATTRFGSKAAGILAGAINDPVIVISNCYNTADIKAGSTATKRDGEPSVSGIMAINGVNQGNKTVHNWSISNCYSTGTLSRTGNFASTKTLVGDVFAEWMWSYRWPNFTEISTAGMATLTNNLNKAEVSADSASTLGDAYATDTYGINAAGTPILTWEAPTAEPEGFKITAQPVDATAALKQTAKFAIETNDEGATYRWEYSEDGGKTWGQSYLTGWKTSEFSFAVTAARADRLYRCKVTFSDGTVEYSDTVSVVEPKADESIKVTATPEKASVKLKDTVEFKAAVEGVEDASEYTFLWYYSEDNGENWAQSYLGGWKTDTFTFAVTSARAERIYRVKATAPSGAEIFSDPVSIELAS